LQLLVRTFAVIGVGRLIPKADRRSELLNGARGVNESKADYDGVKGRQRT